MHSVNTLYEKDCNFLPYGLLEGLLHHLTERNDVRVLTYSDLIYPEGSHYEDNYLAEWKAWKDRIGKNKELQQTVFVLLQHDVDRYPDRTHRLLRDECSAGIRSNTMVFNRMINRRVLRVEGRVEYRDYPLDWNLLRELETNHDFVFGYHSNAYEQSLFNVEQAQQIFAQDVSDLRTKLTIKHFSPHGGNRDGNGQSNAVVEPPSDLSPSLKWVQNGHTIRFDGYFSDGGLNGKRRDPEGRDLRSFLRSFQRGNRYRILIHPQYYSDQVAPPEVLLRAQWYRDLLDHHEKDSLDAWWGAEL